MSHSNHKRFRIVFLGFGTVAQGLARILVEKTAVLRKMYDFTFTTVAVADKARGSILNNRGLDLNELLTLAKKDRSLQEYPGGTKGLSSLDTIRKADASILVETTWTNLRDGEPGLTHIKAALRRGLDVVTSNKGPIALAYPELAALARSRKRNLRFEATVMSGTPAISVATEALAGATVKSVRGILNGTTNYILTEMESGKTYSEALKRAQELGYAEADPTGDVEAMDAAGKIAILANVLMAGRVKVVDVHRQGITELTPADIASAMKEGTRIKLVAEAYRDDEQVKAKVQPERLLRSDILSQVSGVLNALTITTDVQPDVTIMGPGAGGDSAGYALLSDMLAINRGRR
jgi:homoserine dehydrogenase